MHYLFIVSLIWTFSFGWIKNALAGVDANLVASLPHLLIGGAIVAAALAINEVWIRRLALNSTE